jgi:hypothetical protein
LPGLKDKSDTHRDHDDGSLDGCRFYFSPALLTVDDNDFEAMSRVLPGQVSCRLAGLPGNFMFTLKHINYRQQG